MRYLNLLLITFFLTGCSTINEKGFGYLENKTAETAKTLTDDKNRTGLIENEKVAGNAYFYILSDKGRVIYHPEKALTDNDFSRFGFVRTIMSEKNGCIKVNMGNMSRIIIFRETADGGILCLTAASDGVDGSEKCSIYNHEGTK